MVYDVMNTLACAPAVGDGDYVAGAEGGVRVVDEDVNGFVEFLRGRRLDRCLENRLSGLCGGRMGVDQVNWIDLRRNSSLEGIQLAGKNRETQSKRTTRHTFPTNLLNFCVPIRALTVFCIKPADTTTAFICLEAEAARRIVGIFFDLICSGGVGLN